MTEPRERGAARRDRRRLRRARDRGVLRRGRPRGRLPRHRRGADRRACAPARCRSTSRASRRCPANRERLTFTTSSGRGVERAEIAFVCVDTPPRASGDADSERVEGGHRRHPGAGTRRAGDEVDGAAGHGRALRRKLDERGPGGGRLRLEPRVPARGQRDRGLPAARPRRRRAPSEADGERMARSTPASSRPSCAPTSPRRR